MPRVVARARARASVVPHPGARAVVVPDVALLESSDCGRWCVIAAALRETDGDAAYTARKVAGVPRCAARRHAPVGAGGGARHRHERARLAGAPRGAGAGLRPLAPPVPARSPHRRAFREVFRARASASSRPPRPRVVSAAVTAGAPRSAANGVSLGRGSTAVHRVDRAVGRSSDGFAKYPKMAEGSAPALQAAPAARGWSLRRHGANFSLGPRGASGPSVASPSAPACSTSATISTRCARAASPPRSPRPRPRCGRRRRPRRRSRRVVGLQLFGELFGGHYPHADAATLGLAVQRGVWYRPDLLGFDLRVGPRRARRFLDLSTRPRAAPPRAPPARPLVTGSLAECLEHPVEIESTVPALFGLPPIAGNFAEGVVVRPAREPKASDRGLFKRKIPQFSETRYANNGWRDAKRGGGGGAAGGGGPSDEEVHGFEILARVTPPRLAAVMSKLGRVTPDEPDAAASCCVRLKQMCARPRH